MPRSWSLDELVDGVRAGDRRALARAITLVENGDPLAYELIRELYPETGRGYAVGVTGPPGVGKSSLISALVRLVPARSVSRRVSSAAWTKRWLLRRSKLTRPSRSQRRSVSTLTPSALAAAPIRMRSSMR